MSPNIIRPNDEPFSPWEIAVIVLVSVLCDSVVVPAAHAGKAAGDTPLLSSELSTHSWVSKQR